MVTVETPRQLLLKTTFFGYFAGLLVVEMPTDIVMCLGNETLVSNATVALDLLTQNATSAAAVVASTVAANLTGWTGTMYNLSGWSQTVLGKQCSSKTQDNIRRLDKNFTKAGFWPANHPERERKTYHVEATPLLKFNQTTEVLVTCFQWKWNAGVMVCHRVDDNKGSRGDRLCEENGMCCWLNNAQLPAVLSAAEFPSFCDSEGWVHPWFVV